MFYVLEDAVVYEAAYPWEMDTRISLRISLCSCERHVDAT